MLEAQCSKCGEVFVPHSDSEEDLIHGEIQYTEGRIGEECGGQGTILGQWFPTIADWAAKKAQDSNPPF